ncbi:hypothetical protein GCM10009848_18520 [Micromonospora lupini]
MVPSQIHTKAYAGSVGSPIANQAATKATAQTVMATMRRRPPSGDAGGSVRAGGWGSVTTAIAVKVNDGYGIDRRGPPATAADGCPRIAGRVPDASGEHLG